MRQTAHSARATATGSLPCDQRALQRGVIGALPAAGMHDDAALQVEDRNDSHGGRSSTRIGYSLVESLVASQTRWCLQASDEEFD